MSRATRFILLELCILSREQGQRGLVFLPEGMSDLEGWHDLLGGNRKEVEAAFKRLQEPDEDNENQEPMVVHEGTPGRRFIRITSWGRRGEDGDPREPSGASTERSRRHRERQRNGSDPPLQRDATTVAPTVASPLPTVANDTATVPQRSADPEREVDRDVEKEEFHPDPVVPLLPPETARARSSTTTIATIDDLLVVLNAFERLRPIADRRFAGDILGLIHSRGLTRDEVVSSVEAMAIDCDDGATPSAMRSMLRSYLMRAKEHSRRERLRAEALRKAEPEAPRPKPKLVQDPGMLGRGGV